MQQRATKQDSSETGFDRAEEQRFSNKGASPKPDQDTPSSDAREGDVARATGQRRSAPARLFFPARHAGYLSTINGRENQSDDATLGRDLRDWCEKLGCTEAELRDTVRAVMRSMANTNRRPVHH